MKQILMLLAASAVLWSCQSKPDGFTIEGTIDSPAQGKIYLKSFRNKMFFTEDSAEIRDGRFQFSGRVEQPLLYGLQSEEMDYPAQFFLENVSMQVAIKDEGSVIDIQNSPENVIFQENAERAVAEGFNIDSLITKFPTSPSAAYFLYRYFTYQLPLDDLKAVRAKLDPALDSCPYVRELDEIVRKLENVQLGKVAPDFTLPDTAGVSVSLSDFRGKFVLIDFWASWCPPCRRENPNVVAAFEKYRDKNFTVLGVSLDRNKKRWLKAIADDKLTWTHVSDLKYWDSEVPALYGVRGIPSNVLIDPDGVIIGRNLREQELHDALEKFLK